eukprot:CAMPEP_0174275760 /NCGR_PEP_ID=MMETSP0439-20130205/60006_1 /TAXON_ID=0 /ORGANISM="Stereomyxa ramosa, Strain Chinc5" /LENGTH=227 /DNA_ID=CAMNT_0015367905 /DNA_START=996 /DNA_END=1679 /DNA_ORIENTATION=+
MVFFLGCFGDLTTSILQTWWYEYETEAYYSDIVAATAWLISGLLGFLDLLLTWRRRKRYNHKYQYTLLPWYHWTKRGPVTYVYYWLGIAGFFFFPGAFLYMAGTYVCWFASFDACYLIQTLAGLFYLVNALLVFMGLYQLYKYPEIANWEPIASTSDSASEGGGDGDNTQDIELCEVGSVESPGRLDSPVPPLVSPFSENQEKFDMDERPASNDCCGPYEDAFADSC